MKAYEYLGLLQAKIYARDGTKPKKYANKEGMIEAIETFFERRKAIMKPERLSEQRSTVYKAFADTLLTATPTPQQNPFTYSLLRTAAKEVEEAAVRIACDIPQKPLLGTLPSREVNARTFSVPGSSEYLAGISHNKMEKGCRFMA